MNATEIEQMSEAQLLSELSTLEREIQTIDIQLMERKKSMCRHEYKEWSHSAFIARKCKQRMVKTIQGQLRVNKLARRNEAIKSKAPKENKSAAKNDLREAMDREIIEEIRLLITPEQFMECVDRAKKRANYAEELSRIKSMTD